MMAVIDEPTLQAYRVATLAYNRNTYGEVAADHDEGLNAVVQAVWQLAIEARNAELFTFALDASDGDSAAPDDREALVRHIEEPTRAKIAAALRVAAGNYPEELFPAIGCGDAIAGAAMRHAYLNAARIAEGE